MNDSVKGNASDTRAESNADGAVKGFDRDDEDISILETIKPWDGKAQRMDKLILWLYFAFFVYGITMRLLTPYIIAEHPSLFALVSGSLAAVGAASAFASVEGDTIIVPIIFGVIGSIKFSWLFWWAGRRWGSTVIRKMSPSPKIATRFLKMEKRKVIGAVMVLLSEFPGVPALLAYLLAGWQKMNLAVFMVLAAIASSFWMIIVAVVGYQSGQAGVDIVLAIDKYALWIMIGTIFVITFWSSWKANTTREKTQQDDDTLENDENVDNGNDDKENVDESGEIR